MASVLIVDDSKVMREMIAACLRPIETLTLTQASSGLEAIEQISLRPFDLIVLDLNMPDIGGLEVIEFIRKQDKLRHLPILIVTTRGDEGSKKTVLDAGASQFLAKPFTPDAMLSEVTKLLAKAPERAHV
jgi:two-component system chemotaxis response regulator CheY